MTKYDDILGWGLVGTPKGRQQASEGIDKTVQLARIFDLPQDIGQCLPSAEEGGSHHLYYLCFRKNENMLGIASYISMKEMGQSRSGGYFGAFLEIIHHEFSARDAKNILLLLHALMKNNYEQYIDNNSYKRMLDNVSIPEKWIDLLVEVHKNSVKYDAIDEVQMENKPKQDTLYIFIEEKNNDLLIKILSFLLKNKIYILYNNIYFTNSKKITAEIEGNSNIKVVNYHFIINYDAFLMPYKQEVRRLKQINFDNDRINVALQSKLSELQREQHKIISENVEKKVYLEREKLREKELFLQKQQKEIDANIFMLQLGENIVKQVKENNDKLENVNFVSSISEGDRWVELSSKLSFIQQKLLQQPTLRNTIIEKKSHSKLTLIFLILTLILVIISIGLSISSRSSDNNKPFKEIEGKMSSIETSIEDMRSDMKSMEKEMNNFNFKGNIIDKKSENRKR